MTPAMTPYTLISPPPGISKPLIEQALKDLIIERGWKPGTHLENLVALMLSRFTVDKPEQQYKAGRYRLDFAWPSVRMAIEADGWWHRSPEGAAKDRERDCWLRSRGWVIFRVDDNHGGPVLEHQVMRVSRLVQSELANGYRGRDPSLPQ
jgi:very-short-patch-repair endonuclease